MDRIRLSISIVARNALQDRSNKNRMRSIGQWERKIGVIANNLKPIGTVIVPNEKKSVSSI